MPLPAAARHANAPLGGTTNGSARLPVSRRVACRTPDPRRRAASARRPVAHAPAQSEPAQFLAAKASRPWYGEPRVAGPTHSLPGAGEGAAEHSTERPANAGLAGTVIGGKYRLTSEIGRGGMGSVWCAEHLTWEAPVAVKLMNRDIAEQPEARARFDREVRLAAGLRSPHVVQVLDHGVDETTRIPFIAMELLEGESLAQRLKRLGRLSPSETFGVVSQIVRALSRAHEAGIVHRDLKPENIFLVQNDDEQLAKVLDFGIAKGTHQRRSLGLTRPGRILGTPFYMSPEQFRGSQEIDQRADLWSLSVISCECLTGRRPFEANDFGELALLLLGGAARPLPSTLGPVPLGFDAWFSKATHADVERRFQSARELGQALATVCGVAANRAPTQGASRGLLPTDTDGVSAAPPRWQEPAPPPAARWRPFIARLVVSSVVLLVTAAVVVVLRYRQEQQQVSLDAPHAAAPVSHTLALEPSAPARPAAQTVAASPLPPVGPTSPAIEPAPDLTSVAQAPPVETPRNHPKPKALRAHAAVKPARGDRRAVPPEAPPVVSSEPQVDVNGRRIRMTLEPTP
jgi:serine/threonine protein kinase